MTAHLDTSVVVRVLVGDPAGLAARARALLASGEQFVISDLGLLEAAYALRTHYGVPRELVVDSLIAFLQHEAVLLDGLDLDTAIEALMLVRPSGRVSFGDALIWAQAVSRGDDEIITADRRFPIGGITVRRL